MGLAKNNRESVPEAARSNRRRDEGRLRFCHARRITRARSTRDSAGFFARCDCPRHRGGTQAAKDRSDRFAPASQRPMEQVYDDALWTTLERLKANGKIRYSHRPGPGRGLLMKA